MRSAVERRVLIAHKLCAFGAPLRVFSTYVSLAFTVLVQLNYALRRASGPLYRP